jgi:GNAT superfamily N-acetyltransferase
MDRWQFAREVFDRHFAPLRQAGFVLERLPSADLYWQLHEAELRVHFPEEVFFNLRALRNEREREGQERLVEARADNPLRDFTVVRKDGRLAAMFSGEQKTEGMYRMWHTHVHPDFRRQGVYQMIVRGTIGYTAALGFDTITSEHSPGNSPILIAKMRAGFRLYGFELDPLAGPSAVLRYFHNPEHLAAYELRCGHARLTPALRENGTGAWPLFRDQVLGR